MKAVCSNHRNALTPAAVAALVAGSLLLPRPADARSATPPAPEARAGKAGMAASPKRPGGALRGGTVRTLAAEPWEFTLVARSTTEPGGLRDFRGVSVGDNGDVVFVGTFDGSVGKLLRFRGGAVTEIELPEGATLAVAASVLLTPQGNIAFSGACPGATSSCLLKTDGTVLPVSTFPRFPDFQFNNADGKWVLVERISSTLNRLRVTDGVTETAPFDLVTNENLGSDVTVERHLVGLAPDGAYVVFERESNFLVGAFTRIRLAGPRSDVLAEVQFVKGAPPAGQQIFLPIGVSVSGDVLFPLITYNADFTQTESLALRTADGTISRKADSAGPYAGFKVPMLLGSGQRPLFGAIPDAAPAETHVFSGFDLTQDRFEVPLEELLFETGRVGGHSPAPAMKFIAVQGQTASGTRALILASRSSDVSWNAPAGGAWAEAGSWFPEVVPGAGDRVRFGLAATYPVDLGSAAAARALVEAGDVTWRSGELAVGVDGLNVFAPNAGGTARLTIATADPSGPRTTVTASSVLVGFAPGPGTLRLDGATLIPPDGAESGSVEMGFAAPATALVTNGAEWLWTEMSVGMSAPSLLTVEDGAFVGFAAEHLFVGGSPLALPLSGQTGTVVVTNQTNEAGVFGLGTMLGPVGEIVVGETLIGRLEVRDGALLSGVRMDVGTRDHGATTDGFLVVAGINDTEQARGVLGQDENGGLFAATGTGTEAQVTVSDGGRISLTRLSLADGAGSRAVMTVTGGVATPDGETFRSEVVAPIPPEEPGAPPPASPDHGRCVVGKTGFGALTVASGGLVSCREVFVGFSAGSRGSLRIDGAFGSTASRVFAGGPQAGDGDVFVGRSPLFDGPPGGSVRGDVFIGADNVLDARFVLVSAGGRISGNGVVLVDTPLAAIDGGVVAPGIDVLEADPASSGTIRRALAPTPTGTLSVQGGVTFGPGAQLVLEVGGATPGAYDSLLVTGTTTLGGQLTLNFVDGFLPRRGDTFRFIQAGSVLGAFASIVATGLPGGYEYQVSVLGGEVRLTVTCVPITLSPSTLPDGTAGIPYSQALAASGGVEPYGFAVTGGALPGGLTLSPAGTLAGTPTQGGSFSFTVTVTDPGPCAASRAYSLTIAAGGAIASVAPSAGPTTGGQAVTVTGSGLAGATGVTVGGVAAAITSNTDTLVTLTTPPHAPGVVDVVVTTPRGTVTATAAYTYVTDAVAIPTASTLALILFAAALAGVALLRLR